MALTDAKLRTAKPAAKPYKVFDTGGLFVKITPSGGKLWRFRFRYAGKEKLMALGEYPRVSLIEARRRRDSALGALDEGLDPSAEKRLRKASAKISSAHSFEVVAREWHENQRGSWDERYAGLVLRRLVDNIFSELGPLPIADIESAKVLTALKKVEARGILETTRRIKQYCSSIFCYGIAAGYCGNDPTSSIRRALKPPPKAVHRTKLPRDEVGEFLRLLPTYDGDPITPIAIHITLLTATRTKEIIPAQWPEFESLDTPDKALWRIPAARMKMKEDHLVPLSRQAVQVILSLPSANARNGYLFPGSGKSGFISNNTMLYGLYRLGYHSRTTMHGFRRLFSTEANEHDFQDDWIERQLAHDERDDVRGAYNAAQYLPQRRRLMQWWADYLDDLKTKPVERKRAASNIHT